MPTTTPETPYLRHANRSAPRAMALLLCALVPSGALLALGNDTQAPVTASLVRPMATPYGIVTASSFGSALYLDRQGLRLLVEAPGAGNYVSLSPDGRRIGFKEIDPSGRQAPAEVDLSDGTVRVLWQGARRVGQVSYGRDGTIAFTVDSELILLRGPVIERVEIGTYANLCPLSPDGSRAAYNSEDDQLWVLEIPSNRRHRITDGSRGYTFPRWSPDGKAILYSSLNDQLWVYDLEQDTTFALGDGCSAVWSPDATAIAFYRKEVRREELVNTDLFAVAPDGTGLRQLTASPVRLELDPSYLASGSGLLYQTGPEQSIRLLKFTASGTVDDVLLSDSKSLLESSALQLGPARNALPPMNAMTMMDIPYVHQVYDTPDWFNGHWACAPTQAIMVLAYYGILPPWETACSWPTPHITAWGAYVAEPYQFRQTAYTYTADDPSGTPGRGGYGFMWAGSWSPHSRMADYFRRHGMSAQQTEATPYATALQEVTAGYPLSMCVMLTDAGHLVVAHGIGAEPHTFIVNDPYGNKNIGYWNYQGKNVRYDWPGYNNGFQNLNGVAWCIATRFTAPALGDTLVDDLQFSRGFTLATSAPSSMTLWKDLNRGYADHLWFATTRPLEQGDVCSAEWRPQLPISGTYAVSAYIALSNATAALYHITFATGDTTIVVNQKQYTESWAPLGSYEFLEGVSGGVRLGDGSDSTGQEMVFDAVRWSLVQGPATGIAEAGYEHPARVQLLQNSPNPFNPTTTIHFVLAEASVIRVEIFNTLGEEVAKIMDGECPEGAHAVVWDAQGLPSGVYLYRLQAEARGRTTVESRKMLLMR